MVLVYFLVYNECVVSRYQALSILFSSYPILLTPVICSDNIYLLHIHVLGFSFAIWTMDISISGIQCPPTGLQLSMQQFLRFFSVFFFCFGYDILFRRKQNLGSFLRHNCILKRQWWTGVNIICCDVLCGPTQIW